MKVILAGGSGFLGRPLGDTLAARGHEVVTLSRSPSATATPGQAGVRDVKWAPGTGQKDAPWMRELHGADLVINLAGASIAGKRWTTERKRLILSSRVDSTRALVDAIRSVERRPAAFLQGSAVGHYGATLSDDIFDESSPPGQDFLGRTCVAWEAEARPVESLGCRLTIVRTGVALDHGGGALAEMARPFRFFVGGPVASGRQYMSWIHRADWLSLVTWAVESDAVSGVLNATAPNPVQNAEFSTALGKALRRPSWAPVPGFALRLLFGELATELLIKGQRVVPRRTRELGFEFAFPEIGQALASIYR